MTNTKTLFHGARLALAVAAAAGAGSVAVADVVYVDHLAAAGGDGSSWALAFANVNDGVAAAQAGDEVWVASGTYGSTWLKEGVAMLGGFAGDESAADERDWIANETAVGDITGLHDPDVTLDGFITGHIFLQNCDAVIRNCRISGQSAERAAGLDVDKGSLVLDGCEISSNEARIAGGMEARYLDTLVIRDCRFVGNVAQEGVGAALLLSIGELHIERTVFAENLSFASAGLAVGKADSGDPATVSMIRDCTFMSNVADSGVGAAGVCGDVTFVNCVFARNQAAFASAVTTCDPGAAFINCTFADNDGGALDAAAPVVMTNSIVWGNIGNPFVGGPFEVTFSDIQGGWSGAGNISADPIFVQSGVGDVRLGAGSPCIDAGDSKAVPADVLTDHDGNPRIVGAAVDMGAFEGAFDVLPPSAIVDDFDEDEVVILAPDGVGYDPMSFATVVARNVGGGDDATLEVTEYAGDVFPGAGGFVEYAHVLAMASSLEDGTIFATVTVPFAAADLDGVEPLDVDLVTHDDGSGNWALAAFSNTVDSPGHTRRFGDRHVSVSAGGFAMSTELGDYGVVWNPDTQSGFAWAVVDHLGHFGVGVPRCASDAAQPPSGSIGFEDLEVVLASWGDGDGPFDVDGDGHVGVLDLLAVLGDWGECAP